MLVNSLDIERVERAHVSVWANYQLLTKKLKSHCVFFETPNASVFPVCKPIFFALKRPRKRICLLGRQIAALLHERADREPHRVDQAKFVDQDLGLLRARMWVVPFVRAEPGKTGFVQNYLQWSLATSLVGMTGGKWFNDRVLIILTYIVTTSFGYRRHALPLAMRI